MSTNDVGPGGYLESPARKQANITLDQFFVVTALNRVMASNAFEAETMRAIQKLGIAEKLEANLRHVQKIRDEYLRETQQSIVIASAGVINQLDNSGKTPPVIG